jgi:hypothetical protein
MKTKEVLNADVLGKHFRATGSVEVFDEVEFDSVTRKSTVVKPNAGIKVDVIVWSPVIPNIKRKNISVKVKSEKFANNINEVSKQLSDMPIVSFTDLKIGDYKGDLWASATSLELVPKKGE